MLGRFVIWFVVLSGFLIWFNSDTLPAAYTFPDAAHLLAYCAGFAIVPALIAFIIAYGTTPIRMNPSERPDRREPRL
jgi:hypothetical protein